jgi:hypothetical protein
MVTAVRMSNPNPEVFPHGAIATSVSKAGKNETKFLMFEYQPADQLS